MSLKEDISDFMLVAKDAFGSIIEFIFKLAYHLIIFILLIKIYGNILDIKDTMLKDSIVQQLIQQDKIKIEKKK